MHTPAPPFAHTSGSRTAKLTLIGEAWGEEEDKVGMPFVGYSGQELTRMLKEAGIKRSDCFLTNVLALRPPDNKLDFLCGKKAEVGENYQLKPLKQGVYLKPEYLGELDRLRAELEIVQPNLVVCLGATASWALLSNPAIGSIRGAVAASFFVRGPNHPPQKTVATYHPAAILRNWSWRPIVIADLMKSLRESQFPEIRRPEREVLIRPTLAEIKAWMNKPAVIYACDIETFRRTISCIGFARSPSDAICIPFLDMAKKERSYWPTLEDELAARACVQELLSRSTPKLFQNGLFDLQYLWREGFKVFNASQDTMLYQHSLYPEMQKGLGFLGSIHTNEASWKLMKLKNREDYKRDE